MVLTTRKIGAYVETGLHILLSSNARPRSEERGAEAREEPSRKSGKALARLLNVDYRAEPSVPACA